MKVAFIATILIAGSFLSFAQPAQVLLPTGEPASGAQAASLATTHFLRIDGLKIERPLGSEITILGEDGALEITEQTAGRWVILHARGYADVEADAQTTTIPLEPWRTLPGRVDVPCEAGSLVSFARSERPRRRDDKGGSIYWTTSAEIAEDGSFAIPHVPQGFGQVGVLREHKHERRITRWREYAQVVTIPKKEAILIGGGIPLRGRVGLPAEHLPALLSVVPRENRPPAHGVTDDAGNFEIPGLLPGDYRLTARGSLGQSTEEVLEVDFSITNEQAEADLGALSPEALPFVLEIDSRVETTPDLLQRILAAARQHSSAEIQKVWIGETTHPTGIYGARVTFANEMDQNDPTRAVEPELLLEIPGEFFRKFYPPHDTLGFGFRFSDEPFIKERLLKREQRVFPLSTTTIFVPLQEDGHYELVLALFQAIEQGAVEKHRTREKQEEGRWVVFSGGSSPTLNDLQKVSRIQVEKNGEVTLSTREAPFRGKSFRFQKTEEGKFRFLDSGRWIS